MLSAIATSDWHLDKFHTAHALRKYFPDRQDIDLQFAEIEKPFEYAVENGIDNIFVLGDLGENHVLSAEAKVGLLTLLFKYDGVLNIHIILGNHDVSDIRTNSLALVKLLTEHEKFETVHLYAKQKRVSIGEVEINMMPFPHTRPSTRGVAINLAHVEALNAVRDNGNKITKGGIDFGSDPDWYWISGHLHTYQKFKRGVFCGAPYQCTFGENLPCGFLHIKAKTVGEEIRVKTKFINSNPAFTLNNFEVNGRADWDELETDPLTFYKIHVAEGVVVPEDIRTRYPNIVDIVGDKKHTEQIVTEMCDMPVLDFNTGLEDFLNRDLEPEQVKRGLELVKEASTEC